ncbi:unnamed protein product [Ilex paraguariensis]|uniref:F-box associated domain-containing protein n=1 Tax=Ilex paraguariensis TaxID=185542 RepID=A0ABC8RWT0_9AQUA
MIQGIPYWTGFIIDEDVVCGLREVLVYFDPQNEVFRLWPVPEYPGVIISGVRELRNGLALLVYSWGEESCKYVDVWMEDDSKEGLIKRIGPIPVKVVRLIECTKNGEILAESTEGKLFLYDPKTNRVRDILIDDAQALSYKLLATHRVWFQLRG